MARNYSQNLRRYLLSASAQKDEDSFLQFQLARQTHGVCDFILKTDQYETWAHSRSSILLGVVGGPGSGKTIVSAFLCGKARASASENSPVVWLHCIPVLRATRLRLLRALIWKILEQRPDILLKNLHVKKHYIQLFRDATTFEKLWPIFTQIVSCLSELWVIVDSIHDCEDDRVELIGKLKMLIQQLDSRTRIKVALSSRHVSDFPEAHTVLQYTADDMQAGITTYVRHEFQQRGWSEDSGNYADLVHSASNTTSAVGGGLFWARAVVHVAVAQASENAAMDVLSQLESPGAVIGCLWKEIYYRPRAPQVLIQSIAELLVSIPGSPVTITDLYRMLTRDKPEALHGVGIDLFKTVVQTQFCGLASQVNGRYGIPNEIRKHLRPYVEAARLNEAADEPARDRKTGNGDATLDSTANSNLEKNHNGVYMVLFM